MILRLLLALIVTALVHAIDLTAITDFSTNEDTALVVSYATLDGKCTITGGPADRYKIEEIGSNGIIYSGPSAGGSWVMVSAGSYLAPGSYLRYAPNLNVYGTKAFITLRACSGASQSNLSTANIIIVPQPDPPVASNGTYASVTEDTPFIFTYAQLTSTLGISDPDGEVYEIKLVSLLNGTMDHSVGYRIPVGGAITWTPPLNVYTKPANSNYLQEPDYAAFTIQAISPTAPATSAVVTLKTRITGVVDTPSGGVSTLTSFDPIRMAPGTMTEYTYEQLRALAHGSNDVDRTGVLNLNVTNPSANGIQIDSISSAGYLDSRTISITSLVTGFLITPGDGVIVRFIVPSTMPRGVQDVGQSEIRIGSISSPQKSLRFDINPITSGQTGGGVSSSGGGGACGAGATGMFLAFLLAPLSTLRRRQHG